MDINPFEPHILAANLAHAIGHNMGFSHDNMGGKIVKKVFDFFKLKARIILRRSKTSYLDRTNVQEDSEAADKVQVFISAA